MSYAVKYASAFYGPFREAADSAPSFRRPERPIRWIIIMCREGVKEALLDVEEGADLVMVKPALSYLDVITRVRESGAGSCGGLQRKRRVCHDQGGGSKRMD